MANYDGQCLPFKSFVNCERVDILVIHLIDLVHFTNTIFSCFNQRNERLATLEEWNARMANETPTKQITFILKGFDFMHTHIHTHFSHTLRDNSTIKIYMEILLQRRTITDTQKKHTQKYDSQSGTHKHRTDGYFINFFSCVFFVCTK